MRSGTALPSVMSGPNNSGDQTMLLPLRFQVVASMSFMAQAPLRHLFEVVEQESLLVDELSAVLFEAGAEQGRG